MALSRDFIRRLQVALRSNVVGEDLFNAINTELAVGAAVAAIASGTVTIGSGTGQIPTADLGLGDLSGKPVTCSLAQAAEDGTAPRFWGTGQANGTILIKANANATTDTDVDFIVDAR